MLKTEREESEGGEPTERAESDERAESEGGGEEEKTEACQKRDLRSVDYEDLSIKRRDLRLVIDRSSEDTLLGWSWQRRIRR